MNFGLSGKTCLVLGGRSGLGAASAAALAAEGARVFAASRSAASTELPAGIEGVALDLFDRASVDALAERFLPQGVDVLVLNCGGPPPGPAAGATHEQWMTQFEAMAANLFLLAQRLLPPMLERGWGRIVTIGSSGIEQPITGLGLSNAIRGAVLGWSKTLSAEVAGRGVTVNMVLPGRIRTDRLLTIDGATAKRRGVPIEQVEAESVALIPAGRLGEPAELGDVVAFLASRQASYVTGSIIRVDGGYIRSV